MDQAQRDQLKKGNHENSGFKQVSQQISGQLHEPYLLPTSLPGYGNAHHEGLRIRLPTEEHSGPEYYQLVSELQAKQLAELGTPETEASRASARRTRSGHTLSSSDAATAKVRNATTSSRPKRVKAAKAEKLKTPKLTAPLSILTKDMTDIPIRDMGAWSSRSVEVRRKEAEKRNGYVTRPMNSFMMYRSAYSERTKAWCLQNNHQVVSSVSGESWPMEPKEIKDRYNEYARIERINHQTAHPDYKFSPSKAGGPNKKRKTGYSDESSCEGSSDLDDPDADWEPPARRRARYKREIAVPAPVQYVADAAPSALMLGSGPETDTFQGLWLEANMKPLPANLGHSYENPYYGLDSYHMPSMPMIQEIPNQGLFRFDQSLIGVPGGSHHGLFQSPEADTWTSYEAQVDPNILGLTSHGYAGSLDAQLQRHPFEGTLQPRVDSHEAQSEISPRQIIVPS